jgi:hypothetical protein
MRAQTFLTRYPLGGIVGRGTGCVRNYVPGACLSEEPRL